MHRALLVGINEYISPQIKNLAGCVNDVKGVETYLKNRFASEIEILTLTNEAATRKNIVAAFRDHLGKAKKGDTALFYFSGHGATEPSPPDFLPFQASTTHETLVCHDSGKTGIYDIADKELSLLIGEVAAQQADVVVIFDCCHSGTITRDFEHFGGNIREAEGATGMRLPTAFLPGTFEHLGQQPRHLFLAACDAAEKASEHLFIGPTVAIHGLFTRALLDILAKTPESEISYENLMHACRYRIQLLKKGVPQHPKLATFGGMNARSYFLSSTHDPAKKEVKAIQYDPISLGWKIGWGVLHGLTADAPAAFSIFENKNLKSAVASGKIKAPGLAASIIEIKTETPLRKGSVYYALPTYLPRTPLPVYISGDKSDFDLLNNWEPELEIPLVTRDEFFASIDIDAPEEVALFELKIEEEEYKLLERETKIPLLPFSIPRVQETGRLNVEKIAILLLQLSKWEFTFPVNQNPQKQDTGVEIFIESNGKKKRLDSPHVTLDVSIDQPKAAFTLTVENKSGQLLHGNLSYVARKFWIHTFPPTVFPENGAPKIIQQNRVHIPDDDFPPLRQVRDTYQLIISKKELPFLQFGPTQPLEATWKMLNLRGESSQREELLPKNPDWTIQSISIKTLKTLGNIGPEESSFLDGKIAISNHPEFQAKLSISSSAALQKGPESDRYLANIAAVHEWDLVDFSDFNQKQTLLDLHHIKNPESLEETPLQLQFSLEKYSGKYLIAITLPHDSKGVNHGLFPVIYYLSEENMGEFLLSLEFVFPNPPDGRMETGQSLKIALLALTQNQEIAFQNNCHIAKNGTTWFTIPPHEK